MPTKKTKVIFSLIITIAFFIIACSKNNTNAQQEDLVAKYLNLPGTPFNYANSSMPAYLTATPIQGQINTPPDNQITDLGATLGRVLFYDKTLSKNKTISCASCHKQENAFSDFTVLSKGFNGGSTGRNSMSLIDAKYYPNGRFFWDQRTRESYDSAENYYKRAIELDPDYALAYSGLADCYSLPFKGLPQLEGIPIARTYAIKALSLDSTLGEALTTLGFIQSAFDYDWVTSKKTLEKAIELNPNYPTAHVYYGNLLQYTKENTEAGINEIKKALDLDPLSASFNWVLGRNYCFAHKYDLAYTQLKKATTLFPNYLPNIETFVYILVQRKKYSEAIKLCSQHRGDWEDLMLTYALAASGDTISAKKQLNKALNKYPDISLYYLAQAYVSLKEFSNALSTLEKAYAVREIDMYFINVDPAFDPIRDQPEFQTLMKKMNFH